MRLTRQMKIQLAIFVAIGLTAGAIVLFGYVKLPALWFGVGRYTVTAQLPEAAGLYAGGNVTYRGTEVGRVQEVHLTGTGVDAVLSLRSDVRVPSDLTAEVHSQSAIGEQYVALLPHNITAAALKNGDVISLADTSVPPDVNRLLSQTNAGLQAIPHDNLKTMIDESYTAFGGLGPEIARIVKGSTAIAIDARNNLDPLTTLIDQSKPVLDSQTDTSEAVTQWAAHLATITSELQQTDKSFAGVLDKAGPAAGEARQLLDRLQPTLPILLANLVSVGKVAITYHDGIEQLLVLLPEGTAIEDALHVPNRFTKGPAANAAYLDFNLNLNLPPPCVTGFLPASQQRVPSFEDYPDRPAGDLYCRTSQDGPFNIRGAKNLPCETVPGKRAPTVKMCESDEQYVPLNDGFNWKGDPNATLSGQDIPQLAPAASPPPPQAPPPPPQASPPIAIAHYDPATGSYVGPDGRVYTQADLADAGGPRTWQSMLTAPAAP
jgi:phospholipid/cholesterol/gamma-HCH transport system substrate-binding protein